MTKRPSLRTIPIRWRSIACLALVCALAVAAGPSPDRPRSEARKAVTVPVRGIDGIKGAKLINLEMVLKVQRIPPPPPNSSASAAALVKMPAKPTEEPPPPEDERELLEVPPDELGGS